MCKRIRNHLTTGMIEVSGNHQITIINHPATYRGIKHHQQIVSYQAPILHKMPLAAFWL